MGFKNVMEMYGTSSSVHRVPFIKVPTLLFHSMDDPLCNPSCINFDVINQNENVIFGATKYGGHIGHHESIFDIKETWYMKVMLKYLNAFK